MKPLTSTISYTSSFNWGTITTSYALPQSSWSGGIYCLDFISDLNVTAFRGKSVSSINHRIQLFFQYLAVEGIPYGNLLVDLPDRGPK